MSRTSTATVGWTLRRRLRLSLLVLGGVLAGSFLLTAAVWAHAHQVQQRVTGDLFELRATSGDLYAELLRAEASVRGYALSGDPTLLEPYEALSGSTEAAQRLRRLAEEADPEVALALDEVRESARRWVRSGAEPIRARIQTAGTGTLSAEDLSTADRLFDDVGRDFAAYLEAVDEHRTEQVEQLRRDTALVAMLLVGSTLAAGVFGYLLWRALRRWVTDPVQTLAAETRTVTAGALDHAVTVAGPSEIETLAADVDQMRRGLLMQLEVVQAAKAEAEAARAALAQQAEELARSNRELEQFAYVASHDLQEPLRKVASFCQMLQRRYEGQLDERADQYIAFAVDGAKRMQRLINDLLAFSRVGRLSGELVPVDLQDCLRSALRNLEVTVEDTAARVEVGALPQVRGERVLLVQLLQNLVGNALKYRGEAVPHVRVSSRPADGPTSPTDLARADGGPRDSPSGTPGGWWEVTVSDNGIGIDPQYAERIFVIFQRLHAREEYDGTGIGLALCKKIVEHHGGRIWLDSSSELGGATLRFTLPATEDADPAAAPASPPATARPPARPVPADDPFREAPR